MNLHEIGYIDHLPKLDIHGVDAKSAEMYIKDFIEEQYNLKNEYIVIMHGIGQGILLKTTKKVLEKHDLVKDFKNLFQNRGCTVIHLKIREK